MFLGSGSVPCWYPSYQSGDQEFSDVQVSCFCGFHQLDPFAHHLFFSATGFQFSSVISCVCFYFHQLLDVGYRVAYKLVINLITRGRHLR
ncbi:hypothetical protein I79_009062 [Cricetulus griseus]|uniref:Uncharacterized protein n=1 Tax=Cricetulus griseus TaxID=10029 RepID=G3HER8_CRIGR|nr:hypothetical protein I79_009062 [Cricetulus griseus]